MIELKDCPICKESKWENMDHVRNQQYWYDLDYRNENEPVGFKICHHCGFVTYDYKTDDELKESYDSQRSIMQAMNIITCNRKNEYHKAFLEGIFDDVETVLDVGCAQGAFLSLFGEDVDKYGTEWSDAFGAFAKNEYGVEITHEIDESIQYDMISYYHVLEHIQSPEKALEKVRPLLKDDGYLYISVPLFFETLDESSGSMCTDFENLFHLNHVNLFSKAALRNVLHQAGFEIIKQNDEYYGYTVLCKKGAKKAVVTEKWEVRKDQLERYRKAIELINLKEYDKAIEVEPLFPDAYVMKSISTDNMKDIKLSLAVLDKGLELMPDNVKITFQKARLLFQWDEQKPDNTFYSNNIKKAEELFYKHLDSKPANEDCYYFLGLINGKYKKDYDKAVDYLKKSMKINPTKFVECYNFISYFYKEKERNK